MYKVVCLGTMYNVVCLLLFTTGLATTAFAQDLFIAAKNGDLDQVKSLVEIATVSVDLLDSNRNTPIMWAMEGINESISEKVKGDCLAVCSYLIDRGAKINLVNSIGFTPLAYAIQIGQPNVARLLLDKGANYTDVLHLNGLGDGAPLDYALDNLGNLANYNLTGDLLVVKAICDYDLTHGHRLNYDNYRDNYVIAIMCDNLDGFKAIVKSGTSVEGAAYLAFWFKKTDILDWLHAIGQFDPNKGASCNFLNVDRRQSYFERAEKMEDGTMRDYLAKYNKSTATN
jgi:hypothetical protein